MKPSAVQAGLVDHNHKYGFMGHVKTTLEIPDSLYRRLKVTAAQSGTTIRDFVNDAITEKLRQGGASTSRSDPPWMKGFGGLKHLHEENVRIQKLIDEEFGKIDPEDWK